MAAVTVAPGPGTRQVRHPGAGAGRRLAPGRRSATGRRHPPATYRRRRVVAAGLALAVGLSAWVGARAVLGALDGPSVELIGAHVVVVRPGETLWSIAVAQDPHGNVLPLLDRLEAETHDRPLQVGERIVVP